MGANLSHNPRAKFTPHRVHQWVGISPVRTWQGVVKRQMCTVCGRVVEGQGHKSGHCTGRFRPGN